MTHSIRGKCHCGNLSFELSTDFLLAEIQARTCDCSFCRLHGAKNWSDPNGKAIIRINNGSQLQKYCFGLMTADFYICMVCGAYLGAILSDTDGIWSTVNLRLSEFTVTEQVASYGSEDVSSRVRRRKRMWTPTTILEAHHS